MRIARKTDKKTAMKRQTIQVTIKVKLLNQFLPLSLKTGGGRKEGKKVEKGGKKGRGIRAQ